MLFDSHAHLNSEQYSDDLEKIVEAIENSDVEYVMDVGYDLESSVKAIEHAQISLVLCSCRMSSS